MSANNRELRRVPAGYGDVPSYEGTRNDSQYKEVKVENNVPNLSDQDIYYNLIVHNPLYKDITTTPPEYNYEIIPASYKETSGDPILLNPSEYKMAVVKFEFPTKKIPMFTWPEGGFVVTLKELVHNEQEQVTLQYVSHTTPPLTGGNRTIIYVQEMLDSLNNALSTAYTNLFNTYEATYGVGSWNTDHSVTGTMTAPKMYYNSTSAQFNLSYFPAWENSTNFEMYFNSGLTNFFSLFPYVRYVANEGAVAPLGNMTDRFVFGASSQPTSSSYHLQFEEGGSVYYWYSVFKIIVTSQSMPIRPEHMGGLQNRYFNGVYNTNSQAQNDSQNTIQVVTEFTYDWSKPLHENVIYVPPGEWRWIDLQSTLPLYRWDFTVQTLLFDGTLEPLTVSPGDSCYIKILFRRK